MEEVSEMKAGRELDALVAERVMKTEKYWSVIFGGSHYGNFDSIEKAKERAKEIQGDYDAAVIPYYDEPEYSTEISDAWAVVIKVMSTYKKKISIETYDGEIWSIKPCGTSSRSAPHAICLAALKAVE